MDFQIFVERIRPRNGYDRTAARLQFRLLIQFLLHCSGILCILDGIGAIDPVL